MAMVRDMPHTAFVDLFCAEDAPPDFKYAFEEFLFGLSYEQMQQIHHAKREMNLHAVDKDWVARTLAVDPESLFSGVTDPEAMYDSFQRRQLASVYRRLREKPGPRRTAEAILLLDYLRREISLSGE